MIWVFRSYSLTKSINKSSSINKLTSQMNSHCAIFNSKCFHYVRCNKCLNTEMFKFSKLESNVEMFECFNVLKLAEYWYVFFCLFFLHVVVLLFVLKILMAGKRKYTHKTLPEKCQALKDLFIYIYMIINFHFTSRKI